MPSQIAGRHRERDAVVENAFQVVDVSFILVGSIGHEETRWWHLLRVTHNDGRLAPADSPYGFVGRHLASLIEYHNVELLSIYVDVLCYAERAHQHHRTQTWQQRRHLVDDGSYAGTTPLTGYALAQQGQFTTHLWITCVDRHLCRKTSHQLFSCQHLKLACQVIVFLNDLREQHSVELMKHGVALDGIECSLSVASSKEGFANFISGNARLIACNSISQSCYLQGGDDASILLPHGQLVGGIAPSPGGSLQQFDVIQQCFANRGQSRKLLPLIVSFKILPRGLVEKLHGLAAFNLLCHTFNDLRKLRQHLFQRVTHHGIGRFLRLLGFGHKSI